MGEVSRGIVLIGPPGSGKTTVALVLANRLGYRFIDREARLMEAYGSREAFLAVKDHAVAEMHREALAWMQEAGAPWVYESTALTERDFVQDLLQNAFGVGLQASLKTVLRRVEARATGGNLANDLDLTTRAWEACAAAHGQLPLRLRLATDDVIADEIADKIHTAFSELD